MKTITNEQIWLKLQELERKLDLVNGEWLTGNEICQRLRISVSTLYRYRDRGRIGYHYKVIGKTGYRYHASRFQELLEDS